MIEVTNQPPPLEDYNFFLSDTVLREALVREKAVWAETELIALGELLGQRETIAAGADANRNLPVLQSYDRYGRWLDEVAFHSSWHRLMEIGLAAGLHSRPWSEPRSGAHVARAAGAYMLAQIESGVYCQI